MKGAEPEGDGLAFQLLRRVFETYEPLPEAVWDDVRRPWHRRRVERGDVLTRVGEVERTFALVLSGVQRIYYPTPDGGEVTLAFAYAPGFSGVPDSFFLEEPSEYALEAVTDGEVLAVEYDDFARLMDRHRELDRWAWRLFALALRGRAKREREMLTMTARDRYERLLRESPQVLDLVPLRYVASYLGMTPETLSRARAGRS